MTEFDPSRRKLLKATALATSGAVIAGRLAPDAEAAAVVPPPQPTAPANVNVLLRVNGTEHQLMIDPRTTLLDALRERLHLTGTKKGCDQGQCG
ncbi:MAG: aldehyde dehydrogenase iron-sulfur subunit, partial [Herminiimonas sp.]|nr:aldehyde dehydrogenase iron-sulfur subunit [Herminiimonas sp.]